MIRFRDEQEFGRLLTGLADDIIDANIHYQLYKDLLSAKEEFPLVMIQSNTFWSTTLKAHLGSSLYMLTRAYDHYRGALHLHGLLLTIKANSNLFSEINFRERKKNNPHVDNLASECRIPDEATLDEDIASCSDDDILVKTLTVHRGNVLAHRNARNTATGVGISETHPLTHEDFEKLLSRAHTILNRYSLLFEASVYSIKPIGADDFRYIFECVSSSVEKSRLAPTNAPKD